MFSEHERSITFCSFCPKLCRFACPVAHEEARETVTPQAKGVLLDRIRRQLAPLDADAADVLFRCTGCDLHASACELGVRMSSVVFDARAEAVRAGTGHPALEDLPRSLDADEATFSERVQAACDGVEPAADGMQYFPGCAALEGDAALARAGFAAARRIVDDDDVRPAAAPGCCGYPLLAAGFHDAFRVRARRFADALRGADRLLTGDPMCTWTLRVAYAAAGVPFPVEVGHLAEAAAERPRRLRRRRGADGVRAAYHDPCYLGRHLGVHEEPRNVLRTLLGSDPIELPWAERGGYCTGGGGLLPETAPETANGIARELLGHVAEVGADEVVTACPRCHAVLSAQAKGTRVRDLAEWLAEEPE